MLAMSICRANLWARRMTELYKVDSKLLVYTNPTGSFVVSGPRCVSFEWERRVSWVKSKCQPTLDPRRALMPYSLDASQLVKQLPG